LFLRSGLAKLSRNIFRIIGLSLLANCVNTRFLLDGSLHDLGGHILFVVSITILIMLLSLLQRVEQRLRFYPVVRGEVVTDIATAFGLLTMGMEKAEGNVTRAASSLGVSRPTRCRILACYGLKKNQVGSSLREGLESLANKGERLIKRRSC